MLFLMAAALSVAPIPANDARRHQQRRRAAAWLIRAAAPGEQSLESLP